MLELTGFFSLRNQIERAQSNGRTAHQKRNDAINKAREQTNQEILIALEEGNMIKSEIMAVTGFASSTFHESIKRLLADGRAIVTRTYIKSGNKVHIYGLPR